MVQVRGSGDGQVDHLPKDGGGELLASAADLDMFKANALQILQRRSDNSAGKGRQIFDGWWCEIDVELAAERNIGSLQGKEECCLGVGMAFGSSVFEEGVSGISRSRRPT